MAGKLNLNFHLPCQAVLPTLANDAKIQIQFSRQGTKDFFWRVSYINSPLIRLFSKY